jgi:two-component system, OmpR family, sensor histidine kinase VanS
MFRSIKVRFTVIIISIVLAIFLIQLVVNLLFVDGFYVFQKIRTMQQVYEQIQESAKYSEDSLEEIIGNMIMDFNLEVSLADENMEMIYSNRFFDNRMRPVQEPVEPERIDLFDFKKYPIEYYKKDNPTIIKTNMQDGDRIRLLGKINKDGKTYYMVIRLSVKSIGFETRIINKFNFYISSFAIVIGGLIVYIMAKQLAKPIEEINKVAINVSNLDFSIRAKEVRRKDELGSLAVNINTMADRLKSNIDNLKEANHKLELDNELMNQVDEQRKEFIANISHELKTPLAILSGYTELLNNDVPGIDKTFYFETILDETHKMDVLIQSLLNLSNMENRLHELKLVNLDIFKFVEHIYRKNEILIQNSGQISSFVGEPCGMVMADPLYLEEAITNYISNAITYTEKGKMIQMSIRRSAEEVVLSVFNEGGRISEEHLEKIWNSFYREDKSRTRTEQNNIGLGLYIVRSIMNAHHGKCGVENKNDGVEFWISLRLQ